VNLEKKFKNLDNLVGSHQPPRPLKVYQRTDQVLITGCKNQNQPVLTKRSEPPNTGIIWPFLGLS